MAHFWPVGNPPPPRPRRFDRVTSAITHCGSPLRQHLRQRLESPVVKIFLDARRIDDAVVPQGNAVLPVEEGHVAVKIEVLLADGLLDNAKVGDRLPLDEVFLDDFIEIGLVADAVQHLVGANQDVGVLSGGLQAARAEAGRRRQPDLVRAETARLELLAHHAADHLAALPAATGTAAIKKFIAGDSFQGAVQDVIQQRGALENVRRENLVDQGAVHALVLDGHFSGSDYPHDGLPAAPSRATDLAEEDVGPLRGGDMFRKAFPNIQRARGVFAGGRADLNEDFALPGALFSRRLRPGRQGA